MKDSLSPFLSDFVDGLTAKYPDEIAYILLSGSAARGDFVKGRSDIDIIVKTKERSSVWPVLVSADELFWKLDERHGMNQRALFEQKADHQLVSFSKPGSYAVTVFESIPQKSIRSYFNLLHKELMRARSKPHMRILYGRESGSKLVYEDPFSLLITYSLAISLLAMPVFIIAPSRAYRSSLRAVTFTFDIYLKGSGWKGRSAREAFEAKIRPGKGYLAMAAFCLKAPFLILACNLSDIAYKTRTGRLPEAAI